MSKILGSKPFIMAETQKIIQPKKSYGTQLIENYQKQDRSPDKQEAGETTNELGKKFLDTLSDTINKARKCGVKKKIYIHILEKALQHTNGVHWTFVCRESRPDPEQSSYLYSHEFLDEHPKFEYALPELTQVPYILRHPEKYTKRYLETLELWRTGQLK